jgi:hypothetical protein
VGGGTDLHGRECRGNVKAPRRCGGIGQGVSEWAAHASAGAGRDGGDQVFGPPIVDGRRVEVFVENGQGVSGLRGVVVGAKGDA